MFLDALAIAALADELTATATGARVQDVLQPDRLALALELYAGARHYLTLSADPASEGVRLTHSRARRGAAAPTPLTLAAHSRLEGARLTAIQQPAFERQLIFTFQAETAVTLVAELTGRLANLILVAADGLVLAAAHPVTPAMTRARVIMPGRPYMPPPVPPKANPPDVTAGDVAAWLTAEPGAPAWRALVTNVRAVSPLAAREVVARSTGSAQTPGSQADPAAVHAALMNLFADAAAGRWAPSVALEDNRPVAYAPYTLRQYAAFRPEPTLSAALEAYTAADHAADPYSASRAAVGGRITAAQARVERRGAALAHASAPPEDIAALRSAGEVILAFQRDIRPGQTNLVAGFDPAEPLTITLDPRHTPVENAQRYFDRYRRQRDGARDLPARLAAVDAQRATLEQLATDLELATDRAEIDAVHDALVEGGWAERAAGRRAASPGGPLRWVSTDGLTVWVGRNSRQNEMVTFQRAARGDLWLHARDVPGGHVVVKSAGRVVPERTVLEAAALAAWFSRARGDASVAVAVTDVRHVKRLAGGGTGMVQVLESETRTVAPRPPEALQTPSPAAD